MKQFENLNCCTYLHSSSHICFITSLSYLWIIQCVLSFHTDLFLVLDWMSWHKQLLDKIKPTTELRETFYPDSKNKGITIERMVLYLQIQLGAKHGHQSFVKKIWIAACCLDEEHSLHTSSSHRPQGCKRVLCILYHFQLGSNPELWIKCCSLHKGKKKGRKGMD